MAGTQPIEGDYDYIIVGAGSAGCLLANRLSADSDKRVLILEAGGRDNWIWFHIPVGYLFAIGNPRSDWCFKTEPEQGLNGRSLSYPRGKAIGGSSAINAMIYMRGQAADYDHWRQLGLNGWGWDDVLPFFKQHENHFLGESDLHSVGGELRIEAPRVHWDLLDAFRAAAGAGRHQVRGRFQHRGQRRLLRLPRQSEAWPALVGGDRFSQAGPAARQPAAGNELSGRRHCVRGPPRRRRALAAGRRNAHRPLPRRGHPRCRCHRFAAASAALRRRSGPASCTAWHRGRCRSSRSGRQFAGSPAASSDLQGRRHHDLERTLSRAARPCPHAC